MTWVIMACVLVLSALLQSMLPAFSFLGQAKFPLLLAVVVYYALNREMTVMLVAAFAAGFIHDALSPIPLGYTAFCFCVVGWIVSRFRNLVLTDSGITPVLFGSVAAGCVTLALYVLLRHNNLILPSPGHVVLRIAGSATLGLICTPAMFLVTGLLDRLVGNVEVKESIDGIE
jgi:rod shape-determining protein MreD